MAAIAHRKYHGAETDSTLLWPYRTTPLVLPGAKVKKDAAPTESYLRHHPNPMFRRAPPHPLLPHDIVMKHKVTHKQFNSPIGLYSDQNIVDTINAQTGGMQSSPSPVPHVNTKLSYKKTVVYDPSKSETYKALQDEELGDNVQEVVPVLPKVFAPAKKTPPTQTRAVPHPVPGPHGQINSIGSAYDDIQQSYTFKRLMHMVKNEGTY